MRWSKGERSFMEGARVARVATVDAEGVPHNVPICPLVEGGKIYFGTGAEAKKVRNLEASPRVAVVFDEYTEAWERLAGVMVQGRARVVERRKFRALRKKLYARYPQYEREAALEEGEAVMVEVTPERKFSWGL